MPYSSPMEYLAHHGIKGQKWGVRRGPPYPLDEGQTHIPAKQVTTAGKRGTLNHDILREAVRSREVDLKLNIGHQKKHLPNREDKGRSYILGDLATAQMLITELSGTGELVIDGNGNWTHKERVVADKKVGVYVLKNGREIQTDKLLIHYGKKGSHIMAAQEVDDESS